MRVLIVYHDAAKAASHEIFEALGRQQDVELCVLGPVRGREELWGEGLVLEARRWPHYEVAVGTTFRGDVSNRGPYLTGLWRTLRRFQPDIVHVFDEARSPVLLQTLIYRDLLLRDTSVLFLGFENIVRHPTTLRGRLRWKYVRSRADGAAFASYDARDETVKIGFPADRSRVTYWGVPLSSFSPGDATHVRHRLGVPDGFLIGYVGRLEPNKGLDTLIRALSRTPSDVHLLVVGSGPYRSELESHARQMDLRDRMILTGRLHEEELLEHVRAMDVLVLPSETTERWKEQFGRVLAEAMACEVPVIGSDSGAIPEVIGDAGLVFPQTDAHALASAVARLRDDPEMRSRLAERGRRRTLAEFSTEAFARALVAMYRDIAASS